MWFYLSFLVLVQFSKCQDLVKNDTAENVRNTTIEMERITQPSAQSQNVERALTTSPTLLNSTERRKEFKPSPQLETYYEFNKFPVPPALPEAKHFSAYNFPDRQWFTSSFTTEQSWTARVKFPTTATTPTPVKERPYHFYNEKDSNGKSYSVPAKADTFLNKPLDKIPTVDEWNKFHYEKQQVIQKNQFDFTAPVPVYGSQKSKHDFGSLEKPQVHSMQGNPWKKIVKFLTAFIPIGLLISALTPTVITVQNVNSTQLRSRAVDPSKNKLISSLNYFNSIGCEDRILCELVLSASTSQNAEHHVENLLNTFTKEGKAVEKAEEMRKIFNAVKNQDCRPIICKNIKENT